MKVRTRLLKTGKYVAERKNFLYIWVSCYYTYTLAGMDIITNREEYNTEEEALEKLVRYCKKEKRIKEKADASIVTPPKYYDCKELV